MAVGDQNDFVGRLKAVLPNGWFPPPNPNGTTETPILDGVLAGFANCFAWLFSLIAFVNLQGRLKTATGVFLDILGLDFLGTSIVRQGGQSDASWRNRIIAEILSPKDTRPALIARLTTLTGWAPLIFEPSMPMDTGALNSGTFALGQAGGLGNYTNMPFQCFVTAFRPTDGRAVTDADIFAAVLSCSSAATIAWTRIETLATGLLDVSFTLDGSLLG